jgi:hypothetical protein
MYNLQPYEGKTIREIQKRQGGEQVIIYFTDDSFLIVTANVRGHLLLVRPVGELTFLGQAK